MQRYGKFSFCQYFLQKNLFLQLFKNQQHTKKIKKFFKFILSLKNQRVANNYLIFNKLQGWKFKEKYHKITKIRKKQEKTIYILCMNMKTPVKRLKSTKKNNFHSKRRKKFFNTIYPATAKSGAKRLKSTLNWKFKILKRALYLDNIYHLNYIYYMFIIVFLSVIIQIQIIR